MYKAGVYAIIDKETNDMYIGQSSAIEVRWNRHKNELKHRRHHSLRLQKVWDADPERLKFVVIAECRDKEKRQKMEKHLLQKFRPKFNKAHTLRKVRRTRTKGWRWLPGCEPSSGEINPNSLRQRALAAGINYGTVMSRIKKAGMTESEALDPNFKRKPKSKQYTVNGMTGTIYQLAKHNGVPYHTALSRFKSGIPIDIAVTRPKAQGVKIT